jgi:ferredoxin
MGEVDQRYEDNVSGKWYVDKKCILCSVCSEAAPKNFKESAEGDHDVVFKQPENTEEETQCVEAMAACPVEAIGNDGNS